MKRIFLLWWLIPKVTFSLMAQNQIQSPEEFLGYPLGESFTSHHMVRAYFEHIANNSENVKLQEYGKTYEGRPLWVAYVGRENHLKMLDNIQQNNLKRAGIIKGSPSKSNLAVVWLSYNVHGNEAASTEASMAVLHELASGKNEQVNEWLQNVLVVIDPVLNPDGRERYVNWYNQSAFQRQNPNPDSWEHHEPWPEGRANHYLFDLNRDWAWQTQKESQQRMDLYNQWLPHIHADFHEQRVEAPYYFAPAAEPFHAYITDWQREFQTTIGLNSTRYFDEEGWLYFTRERFDLFYPSYGDTYPTFNGAIGMTFEQGGSGMAGLGIKTAEGDTLTLRERIAHHFTTSLSTLETTSQNATKVVENFQRFFQNSEQNPPGVYKSYIVSSENNQDKLQNLTNFLDLHQIKYQQATQSKTFKGWNYKEGQSSSFRSKPGDLVIPAKQPKAVLLQVLFEPNSRLSDSVTYDITAWSVPYMMGLEAYATTEEITGREFQEKSSFELRIQEEKPYAYLLEWEGQEDVKFLSRLMKEGIKVRFAEEPFMTNNQIFKPGTLIITRRGNEQLGDQFDFMVQEAAQEWERPLKTVNTGFVAQGKDFGSESVRYINPPKVAVWAGEGVSSLGFGEVWHYFEQQINYPITILRTDYAAKADWSKYNVMIFPPGRYTALKNGEVVDKLKNWVKNGGKLILMQEAITSFKIASEMSLNIQTKQKKEEGEDKMEDLLRKYGDRERESLLEYNPGSIFRVKLDNTHPLAFGFTGDYYSLKTDSKAYNYLEKGWNVGVIKGNGALVSGHVGEQALHNLEETLVFGVEEMGTGEIIYLVDNPLFRAFWQNGKLLFSNAIFLVGQ